MKVAELLERRRANWQELERACDVLRHSSPKKLPPESLVRFSALYRAACADLALADAYQLPPSTVQYLHRLVARAHNQLYRSRMFDFRQWGQVLLFDVPRRVFRDSCVQFAFLLFWGAFLLSAWLAYDAERFPKFAEQIVSTEQLEALEESFEDEINGRDPRMNVGMASLYIGHNTGIGMQCFIGGLAIVPGLFITAFNASFLGACFGYMARPDVPAGKNFFHFVTAHGPFELTAIVLSAGAGLRIGVSWLATGGMTRIASLQQTASRTMPVMGSAMVLFFLAALIEGFLSPSGAPRWIKDATAVLSSGLLMFYFVVLGFPRRRRHAAR